MRNYFGEFREDTSSLPTTKWEKRNLPEGPDTKQCWLNSMAASNHQLVLIDTPGLFISSSLESDTLSFFFILVRISKVCKEHDKRAISSTFYQLKASQLIESLKADVVVLFIDVVSALVEINNPVRPS